MRTMITVWLVAALLAVLAIATGCEDSPLTAGKDFTMNLTASPSTVRLDPLNGVNTAQTTIAASIFNATGAPQSGLTVYFSTSGGALSSGVNGVVTNSAGLASDVLTVSSQDGATITVTASSAALQQTVQVTSTTAAANHAPVATIVASPVNEQAVNRAVTFSGSSSTDPDAGDTIIKYHWSVSSSAPDPGWTNPFVQDGANPTLAFPSGFMQAQTLSVLLTVSDSHLLTGVSAPLTYSIKAQLCSDNVKPTAVIAGGATLIGNVGDHKLFLADGSGSTDPEGPIQSWLWSCGNSTTPVVTPPGGNGSMVTCDYIVAASPVTYTVSLIVTDQGFGPPSYTCAQQSGMQSVQVVVRP
jgi:hypothetical protein